MLLFDFAMVACGELLFFPPQERRTGETVSLRRTVAHYGYCDNDQGSLQGGLPCVLGEL